MTKTLILMRHAKSGWEDGSLDDIDRPLSDRGRRNAPVMAAWLEAGGFLPDVALVSAARRTQETWDIVSEALPAQTVDIRQDLYLASPKGILDAVKTQSADTVLVLAHNPGIANAAHMLVAEMPGDGAFLRYPTLATAVIRFDGDDWSAAREDAGTLLAFTVPRALET